MLTNQILQSTIDSLRAIVRTDFAVTDYRGKILAKNGAAQFPIPEEIIRFAVSDRQECSINGFYLSKTIFNGDLCYISICDGNEASYSQICASNLRLMLAAYSDNHDKNSFIQNLLLDNLLFVDMFNRSKKLGIAFGLKRAVFIIETGHQAISDSMDSLRKIFPSQSDDFLTTLDESGIVLVKTVTDENNVYEALEETGASIATMLSSKPGVRAKVAYGNAVGDLQQLSKSYKEAKMTMEIARIFYPDVAVCAYRRLGIGRIIFQLSESLCSLYLDEIFTGKKPYELDSDTLLTIEKFFENDLNVSETSRQLQVHRNTLVYRLDRLKEQTGLDIRKFEDALSLKLALMIDKFLSSKSWRL